MSDLNQFHKHELAVAARELGLFCGDCGRTSKNFLLTALQGCSPSYVANVLKTHYFKRETLIAMEETPGSRDSD